MKQVLKYPGAKNRLTDWIIGFIPKHEVYLELFGGSLSVLLNKPRCHIETANDLHGDVVNFFKVLRDKPEELKRLIALTPYSREKYDSSYQESDNEVERARRFCVRCWQGFGCANVFITTDLRVVSRQIRLIRPEHGRIYRILCSWQQKD